MSLLEAKKLEDLKEQASKLYQAYYKNIDAQRLRAINTALKEMTDYLEIQGFNIALKNQPNRGFVASYKDILIEAESSRDDERFFGADYLIKFKVNKKSETQVSLSVKRGNQVDHPHSHGSVSDQIKDYEKRYIPALMALDPSELDGSYNMRVLETASPMSRSTSTSVKLFTNGKDVIDYLFQNK